MFALFSCGALGRPHSRNSFVWIKSFTCIQRGKKSTSCLALGFTTVHLEWDNLCSPYATHRLVLNCTASAAVFTLLRWKMVLQWDCILLRNIKKLEHRNPLLILHNSHQELHSVRSHRHKPNSTQPQLFHAFFVSASLQETGIQVISNTISLATVLWRWAVILACGKILLHVCKMSPETVLYYPNYSSGQEYYLWAPSQSQRGHYQLALSGSAGVVQKDVCLYTADDPAFGSLSTHICHTCITGVSQGSLCSRRCMKAALMTWEEETPLWKISLRLYNSHSFW